MTLCQLRVGKESFPSGWRGYVTQFGHSYYSTLYSELSVRPAMPSRQNQDSGPLGPLFLTEAILKVAGGLFFVLYPKHILSLMTSSPTASSVGLIQNLGSQTLAFSVPLFLASRKDPQAIASRRIVYWAVLARESFLMGSILWQLWRGESEMGGLTRKGLWNWVAELAPFVIGRIWILTWKPAWFVGV